MSTKEPTSSVLPEAAQSEEDFLQRQSDLARAAIANALSRAKNALAEGADPREWTRKYPLIAIGAAAVAGFAAAATAIPSKREQELKHLREIHEALHPGESKPTNGESHGKPGVMPPWLTTLMHEGMALIRPLVTSFLVANLGKPPEPTPADGYGTAPASPGARGDGAAH